MTVAPEVLFLTGYAVALTLVAAGLDAIGRRSTDPWSSPALAGSRPRAPAAHPEPDKAPAGTAAAWPDHDVTTFHAGLAGVALLAALALTSVAAVRHHGFAELALELAVTVLIVSRARHLARRRAR